VFVAFFRAVMPALAGASHMPYPKFFAYNAAGGLVWGTGFVLLGYLAANSYAAIEQTEGRWAALIVLIVVIAAVLIWRIRKYRTESRRASAEN
jgi:membrane protein DedA with SNARE-associated domain